MKDYSEYLICSDYDGTLSGNGKFPKRNIMAIDKFIKGGGHFTLCTGRTGRDMLPSSLPFAINAPFGGSTGGQIYDTVNQKVLIQHDFPNNWQSIIDDFSSFPLEVTLEIVSDSGVYRFINGDKKTKNEIYTKLRDESVFKMSGYSSSQNPLLPMKYAKEICRGRLNVTSNGHGTFELTAQGINKGSAVREIKELVGAKKLICIGDYIGDIDMLKVADISFAVDNAIDEVKAVADFITCHTFDGAVGDILEYIDKM